MSTNYIKDEDGIRGDIPVGKHGFVYLNTKTGEGVSEICNLMKNFVRYQSSKITFPNMSSEDVAQEIYVLLIEAIPEFNIDKKANMLTFLQSHVRNRVINKFKFYSEKKRMATSYQNRECKVKCPSCKKISTVENEFFLACSHCGKTGNEEDKRKWKKYNIQVHPLSFSSMTPNGNEDVDMGGKQDVFSDAHSLQAFLGTSMKPTDVKIQMKIDFMNLYNNLDNTNKTIISMVLEGCAYSDIAKKVSLSEKAVYARVAKIIKSYRSK